MPHSKAINDRCPFFYDPLLIHLLLVYYIIRTSTQPLLLYDPLLFLLIYLNHIRLHKTLSYHSYYLYFFTLLILNFIYIYVHYYVFVYYYYYPALGALKISFYLALYHCHSIITIQFSHIIQQPIRMSIQPVSNSA